MIELKKHFNKRWIGGYSYINRYGLERLRELKDKKAQDIRFTAQKKVNGVWVTTDIPPDIQEMVQDAYKELEPAKEVGPLHHLVAVERQIALNAMINNTEEVWDNELNTWVRPQLQDDLAQRQEEGYQRLYKAIMEVGDEKNYKCRMGEHSCSCFTWQDRAECGNWEEQVEDVSDKYHGLDYQQIIDCKHNLTNCAWWPFCECGEYELPKPIFKGGKVYNAGNFTYELVDLSGGANPVVFEAIPDSINMLGPDAPTVVNEKGGKQSKVEGFFMGLPAKAIIEVAKVLEHGREKYGKDNWRQIDSESHLNHCLQHTMAFISNDLSEGSLGHLSHLACRSLMALEMKIEELENDRNS